MFYIIFRQPRVCRCLIGIDFTIVSGTPRSRRTRVRWRSPFDRSAADGEWDRVQGTRGRSPEDRKSESARGTGCARLSTCGEPLRQRWLKSTASHLSDSTPRCPPARSSRCSSLAESGPSLPIAGSSPAVTAAELAGITLVGVAYPDSDF